MHAIKKSANYNFWLFFRQFCPFSILPVFAENRRFFIETNALTVPPDRGTLLDNSLKRRALSGQWQQHGRTADEAYYGDHQTLQAR
jgi:hypothetical protein